MKLKHILENIIGEDYPTTWDWEEFGKLTSFAERKRYCDKHLEFLVSGSGRLVYKVDNDKVLKLAKNKKGVAQCNIEIELGRDTYLKGVVAPIFDYDSNGYWVEMSIAEKLTKSKFKSLLGYSFDNFAKEILHFYMQNVKYYKQYSDKKTEEYDIIVEDDFYRDVTEMIVNFDMPAGDLTRLSTYGVVKDEDGSERVAVIDYGLTNDVYKDYYS